MMDHLLDSFPPERIKKMVFVCGGAFRIKHEFRNEGERKRFFFILNKNPLEDDRLVMVGATTQIKERKKKRSPKVLVELTPKEYTSLEKRSIIDCESCIIWRKSILKSKIDKHEVEPLQSLPNSVVERLRNAISFSKTLAPIDKRLVVIDEETV